MTEQPHAHQDETRAGERTGPQTEAAAEARTEAAEEQPRRPGPLPPTRFERWIERGVARVTTAPLAPYQTAVVRIGFAATWLFFLLREWPHRRELYGPDGPWSFELARRLVDDNHAFTVLMWSDSSVWFECVYVLALASSAALLLGWRTRTASVLFMIGVLALQNRSVFVGDGGDNVLHLMSIYLVFTRCGQVWSLDARRRVRTQARRPDGRRTDRDAAGVALWCVLGAVLVAATALGGFSTGWGLLFWVLWAVHALWWAVDRYAPRSQARGVCDTLANLGHNGALLVIVVEVCLIYSTAGWYKIQGSRWQDGTAVWYPTHLDYFAPWPELSHLLAGNGLIVMAITYGTVAVQVAFPFTLFNRRVKNVLLAAMITEHLSIAVLLGLPFFSLAMITADAVFLPTVALLWLEARASGLAGRLGAARQRKGEGNEAGGADARTADTEPEGAPPHSRVRG